MNEQPWMTTLRDELRARLAKCEPADRATFLRWYPEGIDNLDEPTLKNAIALVQRTLDADARRAAEQEGKATP